MENGTVEFHIKYGHHPGIWEAQNFLMKHMGKSQEC